MFNKSLIFQNHTKQFKVLKMFLCPNYSILTAPYDCNANTIRKLIIFCRVYLVRISYSLHVTHFFCCCLHPLLEHVTQYILCFHVAQFLFTRPLIHECSQLCFLFTHWKTCWLPLSFDNYENSPVSTQEQASFENKLLKYLSNYQGARWWMAW